MKAELCTHVSENYVIIAQIIACGLFDGKPFSELMSAYCNKRKQSYSRKWIWKCRRLNRYNFISTLTHWGRVTHICVGKLTIIGSDNGLSPDRRQAIIWINAGILLIGPLGTNFSEFLIEILIFPFKKMRFKVSSAKRRPFCLSLNELMGKIISVVVIMEYVNVQLRHFTDVAAHPRTSASYYRFSIHRTHIMYHQYNHWMLVPYVSMPECI